MLRGPPGGPILAGTVSVHDAVLLEGLDAAGGLFGGGDTAGGDARVDEPGLPLSFDVRIDAPSSLRIDNNLARIVSSAELTLQGTYDRPVLLGTVELERGTAFFEGNRYRLNHGTIGFANLNRIEPFVDVEVETDVRVPGPDLSGDGPGDGHAETSWFPRCPRIRPSRRSTFCRSCSATSATPRAPICGPRALPSWPSSSGSRPVPRVC